MGILKISGKWMKMEKKFILNEVIPTQKDKCLVFGKCIIVIFVCENQLLASALSLRFPYHGLPQTK